MGGTVTARFHEERSGMERTTNHFAVSTSVDDAEAARALASGAVEARLAACAQLEGPFESVYWWHGKIERAAEWRVTFKTTASRYPALEAFVKERHPYDVPEIIAH